MARALFSQYHKNDLLELSERLNKDYYEVINDLCKQAGDHAKELQLSETIPSSSLYINLCVKLIEEIRFHIRLRQQSLIPYIHLLVKKTSKTKTPEEPLKDRTQEYGKQIELIKDAHARIKEILFRLQQIAKPLYLDNDQPLPYKILRNEIMIIETALVELFYIEEAMLIPGISEAQNQVHVISS